MLKKNLAAEALLQRRRGGISGAMSSPATSASRQLTIVIGAASLLLRQVPVERIIDLRHRVLRAGLPREAAMFEHDHAAGGFHFAAVAEPEGAIVVSCATFHPDQWDAAPAWRLRGMATDAAYSGKGVGRALLGFAEQTLLAASPAIRVLWCNAREPAVSFYRSLGWEVVSPLFEVPTAGPHHVMAKWL
jgi:GNAT superfamily N-acetyltransferase